ncbi:MAG: Gldg family protein, partial [Rhodospirillales bacterium]|nr:Gldg family protein [Rhodospirillales bacterium]
MRKLWSSVIGVIAVAALLVGANMLSDRFLQNVRLDLTQQHLYTLSPGTRRILAKLKEPVTLKLYYSRQLGAAAPSFGAYADRVRAMLREYQDAAHGKLHLAFFNPVPFSATEDRAMAAGLQGVPLNQGGEKVYFGLVGTNLLDDQRVIPFFQAERERFLEYDLTRLIYELSDPRLPVVGIMSSLPLQGDPRMMMSGRDGGRPWVIMQELEQGFRIRTVPTDAQAIDPDVKVLIVAGAQHLQAPTLYAIDQFVMRGGRLLAMVDPHSEAEAAQPDPTGMPRQDTASDLPKLFDAWGIRFDPKFVVGDLDNAWRVRVGGQVVPYLPWFNVTGAGLAHDDPAMADVTEVTVASAGAIGRKPGAKIDVTPLLTSSRASGLIPVAKVREFPDPASILADFKPSGGPRVIGARIHGVLKSAFSGPPALPAGVKRAAKLPPYIPRTKQAANLVVIGDTDLLADRFWVRVQDFFGQQQAVPFSDNGAFLANLVGTLAGGDDLIGLRGKGQISRPFTLVDEMQRRADAQFQQTQKALQTHLEQTQKKLADLRAGRGDQKAALVTAEQQRAIDDLQADVVQTRSKL